MAKVITLDGIHPSKGWDKAKPKLRGERRRIAERCGVAKCFLRPSDLGYPVCSKRTQSCAPDCRALLAAYSRAKANKSWNIAAKAKRTAKRVKCSWVR